MAISISKENLSQLITDAVKAAVTAVQTQGSGSSNPPATAFHLVPGGDNTSTNLWDFRVGDGLKFFQAATKGIDPRYGGDPDKLQYFLDQVQDQAEEYGFASLLTITTSNNETRSLTTEYGSLQIDQVIDSAKTYQAVDGRKRQVSRLLISFIKKSITPQLLDELKTKSYQITVSVSGKDKTRDDGAVMLYNFIQIVAIKTRSTVSTIIKRLTATGLMNLMEEL